LIFRTPNTHAFELKDFLKKYFLRTHLFEYPIEVCKVNILFLDLQAFISYVKVIKAVLVGTHKPLIFSLINPHNYPVINYRVCCLISVLQLSSLQILREGLKKKKKISGIFH